MCLIISAPMWAAIVSQLAGGAAAIVSPLMKIPHHIDPQLDPKNRAYVISHISPVIWPKHLNQLFKLKSIQVSVTRNPTNVGN